MSAQQRHRVSRKQVLMCVLDGRPWAALSRLGHKTLLGEFSAEYAGWTPSFGSLDETLSEISLEVKGAVIEVLRSLHSEFKTGGYSGAFCSLQLDITTLASQEYCTASVSVPGPGSNVVVHLSLAARVFPGAPKEADVQRWIETVGGVSWTRSGRLRNVRMVPGDK